MDREPEPPEAVPEQATGADGEDLYDAYLDAALRGEAGEPGAWCAARGGAPEAVIASLRSLHGILAQRTGAPLIGGPDAGAEDGLPFERLGDFRLVRRLGEGGMGVVYLAIQESLGRAVALKVIRPELAASPVTAGRFRQEALAVARLRHPHIVAVHAEGEDQGARWMALELVPGRNLDDVLAASRHGEEALPHSSLVRWGMEIAGALASAHACGIVHRDVKPSNIRITPEGRAMLLDFGIARDLVAAGPTVTTSFAGSPAYAAPEQITAGRGPIGPRTDVYALGITLYEGLTGAVPFEGETLERLHHRILHDEPVPLRRANPGVSKDLEVVVLKAIEKDPARRYATATDFEADLRAVLELRPVSARATGRLARGMKWVGRNRALALAAGIAILSAIAIPATLAITAAQDRIETRTVAKALRRDAQTLLSDAENQWKAYAQEYWDAFKLRRDQRSTHSSTELDVRVETASRSAEERRRNRDVALVRAAAMISQAQALDPSAPDIDALWSWHYYLKWTEVRGSADRTLPDLYRGLVLRHDRTGEWARRVEGRVRVGIDSTPPGADVHLFRWVDFEDPAAGGTRRLVLRVPGESRNFSGVPASTEPLAVPSLEPASLAGRTPFGPAGLETGSYVAVLRLRGHETQRVPFHVDHPDDSYSKAVSLRCELLTDGTTPPGFVRIAGGADGESLPGFWIQEREVTVAEYREFLDSGGSVPLPPAGWSTQAPWEPPQGVPGDWPVNGVSWHDARAFARWRGGRSDLADRGLAAGLPRRREWLRAAQGGDSRPFVHGNAFHPKWVKSRFARAVAGPEPVMSYPVDRSPFGVLDLAGSVAEWCDPPADRDGQWDRTIAGGSWEDEDAARFETGSFRVLSAEARVPSVGFRLVLRAGGERR